MQRGIYMENSKEQDAYYAHSVPVQKIAEKMNLKFLNPTVKISHRRVIYPDVIRPSFQLAGYFDFFAYERIQIIGFPEYNYMNSLEDKRRAEIFEKLLTYRIPAFVFCRGLNPSEEFLECATRHKIPIFQTELRPSHFVAELVRWLNVVMAPRITMHGVLVDVYGEGVMIMGESGIGKSEAALELLRRGHRLVTDDLVEIHKVSDETLVGTAPDVTRHFIELRGIGIVDVKSMFGVEAVKETQTISLVIQLEEWDKLKDYDRLGLDDEYMEILGNKVVCHRLPIRPGRNLAIIVETAAVNYRQKKMGYNAAEALYKRVSENMARKESEKEIQWVL